MSGENPYQSPNPYQPPAILEDYQAGWWSKVRRLFFGSLQFPIGSIFIHYGVLLEMDVYETDRVNAYIPLEQPNPERFQQAIDEACRVFQEVRMAFPDYAIALKSKRRLHVCLITDYARLDTFSSRDFEIEELGQFPKPIMIEPEEDDQMPSAT